MVLSVRIRPILSFYLFAVGILMLTLAAQSLMTLHGSGAQPAWSGFYQWLSAKKLPLNALSLAWFALVHRNLYLLLFLVGGASPSIAAIIVAFLGWGKQGLILLCQRLKPWGRGIAPREAVKVYVILGAVLVPVTAALSSAYLVRASRNFPEAAPLVGLVYALSIPLLDLGGTLEELGWRGFALPHLEKRMPSPLAATLVLGTLWAAWHIPFWIPSMGTLRDWVEQMIAFFLGIIALAILMTYLFHRTGGSIVPAIVLHGTASLWTHNEWSPFPQGAFVLQYLGFSRPMIICAAVFIIVKKGPQLGRIDSC